jgi:protease-4
METIKRHSGRRRSAPAWFVLLTVVLSGCILNISIVPRVQPLREKVIEGEGRPKILLLDLTGFISEKEKSDGLRTEPSLVSNIRESLKKAEEDRDISGVILRVNSPGGTVSASDIIHHELTGFRKKRDVPVYACVTGLGASGAYYISASADRIYANPASIVGSIGVIALKFNVRGLLDKVGIEEETVKSADKKDILSPFRPNTQEERDILDSIMRGLHDRFVDTVLAGRAGMLTREELNRLSDGRPYTAGQALASRLVDRIGYLDDAVEDMKKALNIEDARLVAYHRPGGYRGSVYSDMGSGPEGFHLYPGVEFMYLYNP